MWITQSPPISCHILSFRVYLDSVSSFTYWVTSSDHEMTVSLSNVSQNSSDGVWPFDFSLKCRNHVHRGDGSIQMINSHCALVFRNLSGVSLTSWESSVFYFIATDDSVVNLVLRVLVMCWQSQVSLNAMEEFQSERSQFYGRSVWFHYQSMTSC